MAKTEGSGKTTALREFAGLFYPVATQPVLYMKHSSGGACLKNYRVTLMMVMSRDNPMAAIPTYWGTPVRAMNFVLTGST